MLGVMRGNSLPKKLIECPSKPITVRFFFFEGRQAKVNGEAGNKSDQEFDAEQLDDQKRGGTLRN